MNITKLVNICSFLRVVSIGRFEIGARCRFRVDQNGGRECWERSLVCREVRRMERRGRECWGWSLKVNKWRWWRRLGCFGWVDSWV
jgi:hypothetical protein